MDFKIIAVDFDGTLCEDKWPEIGEPNRALIAYLKKRQAAGDKLVLWTCRVGEILKNAVTWAAEQGIIFDAVNENLPEVLEKMGGDSRKIFADEYIDDKNMPMTSCNTQSCRYKNECPSCSGWCEGPKQDYSRCVPFLITAYENTKQELEKYYELPLTAEELWQVGRQHLGW